MNCSHTLLVRMWLVQPLWKTIGQFLGKLRIDVSCDPAIPLQGVHPKEKKLCPCPYNGLYTRVHSSSKTLENPLDCKEIQPVHPKGDQSWVFIGRTDVEAETPILWLPNLKSRLLWKDPDAGKDWRQEEKGMAGWNGWVASLTQWTWVWASSRSLWWTGKPGLLESMGLQRVGHDWATELNYLKTPKLETTHMFNNRYIKYHAVNEYSSAIRRNELLINAIGITWLNLNRIVLSERNKKRKDPYCLILFI